VKTNVKKIRHSSALALTGPADEILRIPMGPDDDRYPACPSGQVYGMIMEASSPDYQLWLQRCDHA